MGRQEKKKAIDAFLSTPLLPRRLTTIFMTGYSSHRVSFTADSFGGVPPSPRTSRHMSISAQNLRDDPPVAGAADPKFAGRDWRSIQVGELVGLESHQFVDLDIDIESATTRLTTGKYQVLLVRETPEAENIIGTFDFNDLNAFLLFNIGVLQPDESQRDTFNELGRKARGEGKILLRDLAILGKKERFVTIPDNANLSKAIETFGGGVHRVVLVKEGTDKACGVLSQFRVLKFLWENRNCFPDLDKLYPLTLDRLSVGSQTIIAISGEKPLQEALKLMFDEGVTSIAVLDQGLNVIGNISTVDTRHLTKASALPILSNTCINFCRIILSERGLEHGRDSFPVFHVSPYSTLAHTVAKLIATISHRMWITDAPSPSSSAPPTPSHSTIVLPPPSVIHPAPPPHSAHSVSPPQPPASPHATPPFMPTSPTSSIPSGASGLSGRLCGVVSLTDILNLFARASGLNPSDPAETRKNRRRSSSSSVRPSLDSVRPTFL
ncbi:MAG: cell separation during budding [Cirrosporium novae-zelandiae]|nr:MAG: cell separation during budding [Cirrosporium novae-zelandiae]